MSTLAIKDPTELKGYTLDFTPWMDDLGVTISSITSVIAETGLTVVSSALDSTSKKITAIVSGGTAANLYKVIATFVTSNGYTLVGTIRVPVENK